MSERIVISHPILKNGISPGSFQSYLVNNLSSAWNTIHPKEKMHSFRADRGAGKDQFLNTSASNCSSKTNPFNDAAMSKKQPGKLSDFISNPESFTVYRLIGAMDRFYSSVFSEIS